MPGVWMCSHTINHSMSYFVLSIIYRSMSGRASFLGIRSLGVSSLGFCLLGFQPCGYLPLGFLLLRFPTSQFLFLGFWSFWFPSVRNFIDSFSAYRNFTNQGSTKCETGFGLHYEPICRRTGSFCAQKRDALDATGQLTSISQGWASKHAHFS